MFRAGYLDLVVALLPRPVRNLLASCRLLLHQHRPLRPQRRQRRRLALLPLLHRGELRQQLGLALPGCQRLFGLAVGGAVELLHVRA